MRKEHLTDGLDIVGVLLVAVTSFAVLYPHIAWYAGFVPAVIILAASQLMDHLHSERESDDN
jgi:hypothetical protein